MKKIMKPFVLVAAAAMALASCQKNEISAPVKQDVHFTINAGIESKTSIVEGTNEEGKTIYTPQWDGNEELGLLFAAPTDETAAKDVVKLANTLSGRNASFQGNVEGVDATGTFYSFYPASAFNRGYEQGDARLYLKNVQKPTATSFDPTCDILVAKPYDYSVEEGSVVANGLQFARIMSVLRIDLKSEFADVQNEFVESISFTAGDVEITGYARIFLDNPDFTGKWASSGSQWCTVTAKYDSDLVSINGASNSVYLVIAPVTIPANKDLTFEIKTKNYNISKTVKSPEMKFTAGKVSNINLSIAAENCEKIDLDADYSGEYLIVGKEGEKCYAAKKYESDNYLSASEIEFDGENIIQTETITEYYMNIQKVVGGDYDGMYTIRDAGGKYLSTSSSSSNNMKAVDQLTADTYWTIEKDDEKGTYSIVASKSSNRNDMRFNYNSGSPRVSCYDGSKTIQPYLFLFSTSLVKEDTTPRITLAKTSDLVSYDATSYEFTYTTKNISGEVSVTIKEGATMSNVSASANEGTVTVTFDPNSDTEQKTATIVLSYEGADPQEFVLTQAGKPAEGEPIEVTDVLTRSTTGVTSTTYSDWSDKKVTSSAIYAGNSAGGKEAIQLRSTDNSGVVTTTSGGKVKKIKVTWQSSTSSGRTLDIYGKNTSYTSASDLYDTNKQGTKLGSIVCGTSTELVVNGEYEFIGLRSKSGAMYLSEIAITWASGSEGGESPDPDVESVTVTLNPGDSNAGTWENSQKTSKASVGNVTFTALGTGGNDSKYYAVDQTWRFYTQNTSGVKVSVPTGSSITKVVITVTKGSPSTPSGCTVSFANKVYTYTVSNSPTELSFFKSESDILQINKIEVTYTN